MSDPQYDPLYHQAVTLQYRFNDYTQGADHAHSYETRNQIRELVNDIHAKKNPHDIVNRIQTIQNQLKESQHMENPYMQYAHSDYLHHDFEQMRQSVHKFSNYS